MQRRQICFVFVATGYFGAIATSAIANNINDDRKLMALDAMSADRFGSAVAVSGTTGIVTARLDTNAGGSDAGAAYIFDVSTGQQDRKLTAGDGAPSDQFGVSVGIDGTFAIVGAHLDDDNGSESGSAYVFTVADGGLLHKLTADDGATGDQFGIDVDISGAFAIVGAHYDDENGENSGSAYIFNVTTGAQIHKLTPNDGTTSAQFGFAVAIDGNTAVVGAYADDHNGHNSGSAYVFDVGTGAQVHKLTPADGAADDFFGYAVDVVGGIAVIGAPRNDDNGSESGSAYLFDVASGQQLHKLLAEDADALDQLGISVAIDGGLAIVGSQLDDSNGSNSGSVYGFDVLTGQQLAKFRAGDGASDDQLGQWLGVAISGTTVLAGAERDDNEAGLDSGAAYVFTAPSGKDCRADWDGNGVVNAADVAAFLNEYFATIGPCP